MKSQVAVLNEIIVLIIGVALVISLALFISGLLVPKTSDYVFEESSSNFLNYIDTSFLKFYSLTEDSNNINITYRMDLPSRILDLLYYLEVNGRTLCLALENGKRKCITTSLPYDVGFSGYFISGTKMQISLQKGEETVFSFSNFY